MFQKRSGQLEILIASHCSINSNRPRHPTFTRSVSRTMKSPILSLALLAASVAAVPVGDATARGFETMGAFSSEMSKRQSFSVVENQLGLCRPVTVIFARGTIELGNVGSLAGPPFFNALDFAIGAQYLGIQGVPYPASIWGYLTGCDVGGGKTLAALTEQAMAQCPDSQIVLSGYRYIKFGWQVTSIC